MDERICFSSLAADILRCCTDMSPQGINDFVNRQINKTVKYPCGYICQCIEVWEGDLERNEERPCGWEPDCRLTFWKGVQEHVEKMEIPVPV